MSSNDDVIPADAWHDNNVIIPPYLAKWPSFADDIFWCIFVNKDFCILIKISLKFVPDSPIDNNLALV